MAVTDPKLGNDALWWMALAAVLLGFSSATQDIVIDAYRIESADKDLQSMLSAMYIAGYRIGMVVAGAGALYIADYYGSTKEAYNYDAWRTAYFAMAAAMGIGVLTTLVIREPDIGERAVDGYTTSDYLRFILLFLLAVFGFIAVRFLTGNGWGTEALSSIREPFAGLFSGMNDSLKESTGNRALAGTITGTLRLFLALGVAGLIGYFGMRGGIANREMVSESYVDPVRDFFRRYGMGLALLLLALVGLYRISDIVLGVISNVFYQDVGFTKTQIASVSKLFGLLMTIAGGFLGGILAVRYGVMRILFLGAVLSMATNLLFIALDSAGPQIAMLYAVIGIDNLSAGLASAAFVAFLSSLTNISFTAVQYAIFSSLMTLLPKIIGGYSGTIVEASSYSQFFMITFLMGIPVLLLIWIAGRKLDLKLPEPA
jgi:PAT family beta-lactamase induction signal transducer AmpG